MRDLASVELHFTKHSSVISEKTSRTGGLRCTDCTVSFIKIQEYQMHPAEDGLPVLRTTRVVRSKWSGSH